MLLDKMKLNYEVIFINEDITQETIDSCNTDTLLYLDDVEIPYGLDEAIIFSLEDATIT